MKVTIAIEGNLEEPEVMIRCSEIDAVIQQLQQTIRNLDTQGKQLIVYKNETEYYLPLHKILFFETNNGMIDVHTARDVYQVKYKLYELENLLPGYFMRVSKSTILNTRLVYSLTKNITASSLVEFEGTHKQVYVSRNYYKALKLRLEEKRISL